MSRRSSLTRTAARTAAFAASIAAVAAFAPTAAAGPLDLAWTALPPLFQEQKAQDRLTVTVVDTNITHADGTYELKCGPSGGTHPEVGSACARLDELAGEGRDPFAPVPEGQMCTMQMGGPATARVTGTWRGRSVDATFSRKNGCEITRWQNLVPVLPAARG
ncbi:SSI family serine proteinase inhibitor [Streptomyces sp. IB2014 016-6]|uniref:SSI family serine proteinase inhibitor n=1 Tax=Streptomyces sp. IB2014 016-6 TaxID=2517818 RepID=UPI001F5034F6|nr:SSI family serine proteinase inhibitor [Streptomyces sp. IB2014 016-6]